MNWLKGRLRERTTLDGVTLVVVGGIILLASPFPNIAAWGAIIYGAWTIIKKEK